jgi:hypothetical protein
MSAIVIGRKVTKESLMGGWGKRKDEKVGSFDMYRGRSDLLPDWFKLF